MKVKYLNIPIKEEKEAVAIAIGYFDGVHLGHKLLLEKSLKWAKEKGFEKAVFTFDNNLHGVLGNKYSEGELTPLPEKIKIFEDMGFETCYVLAFNKVVSELKIQEFKDEVLHKLGIRMVVCGTDFRFGYQGKGSSKELEADFITKTVPLLEIDGIKVSSTLIHNLLKEGKISEANRFLGRDYLISGEVIKGRQNGKKIGYPTANIKSRGYVLPKNGVYQVRIDINGKEYTGLANVGIHPTVETLEEPIVEVHVFDFDGDLYGQKVTLYFQKFIRDEQKFESLDELKKQIDLDTLEGK